MIERTEVEATCPTARTPRISKGVRSAIFCLAPTMLAGLWIGATYQAGGLTNDKSPQRDEIRARRFVLVGHDGTERGELSVDKEGLARMAIWDRQSKVYSGMSVEGDGDATFEIRNENEQAVIDFGTLRKSLPISMIRDAVGNRRFASTVTQGGFASFGMYDEHGTQKAEFAVTGKGDAAVVLREDRGKDRAQFMMLSGGASTLRLLGKGEEDRVVLQVDADSAGHIALLGEKEKPIWLAPTP